MLWWKRRTVDDMVESFILARRADGRAPRTIRDYHRALDPFAAWCRGRRLSVKSLNRDHIREYVADLRSRGWAEGTVAIHVRNLRTFLRWLYEEGYTSGNLAEAVKAPRKVVRVEEPLTIHEIRLLLSACHGDDFALRDRAIILVFVETGLRRGEMARLKRGDVHLGENSAWIQVYAPKTKTYRFAFLQREATTALREYLASRRDNNEYLWIGARGPLTDDGIYQVLRRRAVRAGLNPHRVHPHAFRKFFATWWVQNGGDTIRLQHLGGWTSPEMLKVYVLLARREELEQAHRQISPADAIFEEL